jgi:hypothetical protein
MRDWHRIFGVSLAYTVTRIPFQVIQEMELSRVKQRLDVVIIRTQFNPSQQDWPELPDGLTVLTEHNRVGYKSIHESLPDRPCAN